ncbi:MAG TPA: hypothetical protein PK280_04160 [Planctomycetota bacterium]|nr:hypothetical protein [Planctomycetota bacterium]
MAFTTAVSEAGLRWERPAGGDSSPVLAAYHDLKTGRLSIRYRAETLAGSSVQPVERWVNVSREKVAGGGAGISRFQMQAEPSPEAWRNREVCALLDQNLAASLIATHPAWRPETMQALEVIDLDALPARPPARFLGLRKRDFSYERDRATGEVIKRPAYGQDMKAYYEMEVPELGGPVLLEIGFCREDRTAGGCAALWLLPVAVALDVVTAPVQFVVLTCRHGYGPSFTP